MMIALKLHKNYHCEYLDLRGIIGELASSFILLANMYVFYDTTW